MVPIRSSDNEIYSPEEYCHQMQWSAAATIASNDDLLTEILVRTPLRSLIRFKSVSRQWFSLISASRFSLLHTLRHPYVRPSGIFLRENTFESKFEFVSFSNNNPSNAPFRSLNFASGIKMLESCNGLLLCSGFPKFGRNTTPNYYICNPTTKQYSTLLTGTKYSDVFCISLAFDPFKSVHYKVICICTTSAYRYRIDIYSSETRSWRSYKNTFATSSDMRLTRGVFWNGSIHWISVDGSSLRFDVDHECLGTMPSIPVCRRQTDRYFGECNGHLHFIEIYETRKLQFDVLEMERDYSEWFVKYRVDLVKIINAFPEMVLSPHYLHGMDHSYSILGVVREDDEDESSLVLHVPGKVLFYKFKDNTFKVLHNLAPGELHRKGSLKYDVFDAFIFTESLALV